MSIEQIGAIQSASSLSAEIGSTGFTNEINKTEFLSLITGKVDQVNNELVKANDMFASYVRGEDVAIHDVMIAMGKAKTELQLFVEVRNKIVESYKEITRIQL